MKTKFLHLSKLLLSLLVPTTMMISCSYYDEEDATIIAYLKINDLLETKLEKTCEAEISAFENAAEAHEKIAAADFFGVYDVFGVAPDDEFLAYDEDAITSFYEKYYIDETESFNMKALEADISSAFASKLAGSAAASSMALCASCCVVKLRLVSASCMKGCGLLFTYCATLSAG